MLIDATIIRGVLLPATMKLLGDWNWYLPKWLEWLPRVGPARGTDLPPGPEAPGSGSKTGPEPIRPRAELGAMGCRRRLSWAVTTYVCVVEVRLHLNDSHDLKGKRKVLHSLKAQLRQRFGASVAEVDGHDTWQRSDARVRPGGRRRGPGAPTSWSGSWSPVVRTGAAFDRDLLSLADIRG